MSSADLHPEDLLDRVRRGQATAAERESVNAHLAGCEACRFEQAVLAESMRDASPQSGDAARARAIEHAALAALAQRGVLAGSGSRKRRRLAGAWIAAAVVSSIATAAAAAVIAKPAWLAELIPQLNAQQAEAPKPLQLKPARRVTPAEPAPVITPPPAPELEAAEQPQPERARPRKQAASAAELFANANEARREQKTAEAVRLYRELQRAHPVSPEASVARVALGRLLLDRTGDARGALQCTRERMNGRADVVQEARQRQLRRPDAPSRLMVTLEHEDRPASLSQEDCCSEAIGATSDHDGVEHEVQGLSAGCVPSRVRGVPAERRGINRRFWASPGEQPCLGGAVRRGAKRHMTGKVRATRLAACLGGAE